eukprot:366349-Chlamydomonas_euryale.AAC.1
MGRKACMMCDASPTYSHPPVASHLECAYRSHHLVVTASRPKQHVDDDRWIGRTQHSCGVTPAS